MALAFEEPVKLPRDASSWDIDGWRVASSCRDLDANMFFPAGETGPAAIQIAQAKAICRNCPVQMKCLEFALATHQDYGIWGGTTEEERREIRRGWRRRKAAQQAQIKTA